MQKKTKNILEAIMIIGILFFFARYSDNILNPIIDFLPLRFIFFCVTALKIVIVICGIFLIIMSIRHLARRKKNKMKEAK